MVNTTPLDDLSPAVLTTDRPIHFSGVGGSAMNGLATLLSGRGFSITGTDPGITVEMTDRLRAAEISVYQEQDGSHIPADAQLVVATAALRDDHPELIRARGMGIPVVKYARMLGMVMSGSHGIAIAGTHGKTTTSAMTVAALDGAGVYPEFIIGGVVTTGSAPQKRNAGVFVAEACEYDRSFLNLFPRCAIITNIEADHLDVYRDLADIIETFGRFVSNIPTDGTLVYCRDSATACEVAQSAACRTLSYGLDDSADVYPSALVLDSQRSRFDVCVHGRMLAQVSLLPPGIHNVQNALGAFAAAFTLGHDPLKIAEGLAAFTGVGRRFEFYGEFRGVAILDDYAHHPTEIRMLLGGVSQRFPGRRVVVLFQPHQISRTAHLFEEFSLAFKEADLVLLPDIYAARDHMSPGGVTSQTLAARIVEQGTDAQYAPDFAGLPSRLVDQILHDGDVFLTVGAGNVYEVARQVRDLLQR